MTALLRPVATSDAAAIWGLVDRARNEIVGMGSLPSSTSECEAMCSETAETVALLATGRFRLEDGQHRRLLLVVEDTDTGQALGVSGITFKQAVPNLAVQVATSRDGLGLVMASASSPWTRTELDSSFLGPDARGRGMGTLSSRGRLMLLHLVQSQVPTTIASHIRGKFDSDGSAPFWRCFGAHFACWPTSTEAEKALTQDPSNLAQLSGHVLPVTPIVLESLGLVNAASMPAFHSLMSAGLLPNGMYDPIDGGPTVVGEISRTATAQTRIHGRASYGRGMATDALVSVASIDDFRVVRTRVDVTDPFHITLEEPVARAVGIEPGTLLAVGLIERRK